MNAQQTTDYLKSLTACDEAMQWQDGKDMETAWRTCHRSDWMLWLLYNSKADVSDKTLRLIAVKCARLVQHLMTDQRSIHALDVAERFANGEATVEEWAAASDAARAAAWAAARAAAWAAARAAAWDAAWDAARDAAWDAARAAAWGAARAAAWGAAWDAARDAAWDAAELKQADIIREFIPVFPSFKTVSA